MVRELLIVCLALAGCSAHAVVPLVPAVAPIAHSHGLGLVHGYSGLGLGGHGYTSLGHIGYGQGLIGHGLAHHGLVNHGAHYIHKRSPHYVPVGHGAVGHLGGVGHVAPVAVSHQSRVDVRSSAVAPVLPVVQPVVAPIVHSAPIHHAPLAYGGLYGHGHSHLGLY